MMKPTHPVFCFLPMALPLVMAGLVFSAWPTPAQAISFEALQHDGYGVVSLRRPKPNTLIVHAEIDGRKRSLVVDTGWGSPGLSLLTNYRNEAPGATEQIENFGNSVSGTSLGAVKRSVASRTLIGNCRWRACRCSTGISKPCIMNARNGPSAPMASSARVFCAPARRFLIYKIFGSICALPA